MKYQGINMTIADYCRLYFLTLNKYDMHQSIKCDMHHSIKYDMHQLIYDISVDIFIYDIYQV